MSETTKQKTKTKKLRKHPGQILRSQFMNPIGIMAGRLAIALCVPPQKIYEILNGRRGITAETALRLAGFFGTTAEYWLNLQSKYELACAVEQWAKVVEDEVRTLPSNLIDVLRYRHGSKGHHEDDSSGSTLDGLSDDSSSESSHVVDSRSEITVQTWPMPEGNNSDNPAYTGLSDSEKKIFDLLPDDSITFDALLKISGMSVPELCATLGMLDIAGLLDQLPGDRYAKLTDVYRYPSTTSR